MSALAVVYNGLGDVYEVSKMVEAKPEVLKDLANLLDAYKLMTKSASA